MMNIPKATKSKLLITTISLNYLLFTPQIRVFMVYKLAIH